MVTLNLAVESDFNELREFRAKIYGAELGIQEDTYQDVFHDYLSKNVVLRSSGRLVGAVRLAFSRESQEFYLSYLSIESTKRNRCNLRLLLGGVFFLMKTNNVRQVRADAADTNLAMYIGA